MFIALDEKDNRIKASNANKEAKYRCPVCGNEVILKSGLKNVDHFAHVANECEDTWNYDMSAWHIEMQSYFPVENREVVVKSQGKVHRADVLVGKTVIEMQHSPISAEEFNDRNEFFRSLGYRLVWVFDVRDKRDNDQIEYLDEDTSTKFKWSHPMRIFEVLDKRLSDYDKYFAIYFHIYDEVDDESAPYIYRVVWTKGNDDDAVDFSRFVVSEEGIDMGEIDNVNEFFTPLKEKRKVYATKRLNTLKQESLDKGFYYSIKYIGEKGKSRDAYTCKRSNKFGVRWSGEDACCYCKYCALVINTQKDGKKKAAFYCCYPHVYREPDDGAHPGYECFGAEELDI